MCLLSEATRLLIQGLQSISFLAPWCLVRWENWRGCPWGAIDSCRAGWEQTLRAPVGAGSLETQSEAAGEIWENMVQLPLMTAIPNHTTTLKSPARQAEPKQERQNPHMEPGDLWKRSLRRARSWGREPELERLQGLRLWQGRRGPPWDHSLWHKPEPQPAEVLPAAFSASLPAPMLPPQTKNMRETRTGPPGNGVTAVSSWYLSGLGSLLHPCKSKYCLGL